ncbi:MAG: HAMP domain-containing histidine kinase [Ruminococcus sp.]|nr:HAMP domain-containing histidine kinase [Ruminococcus sp.]
MSIWFCLFIIILGFTIYLLLKLLIIKKELKNIEESLFFVLNTDTNNLITLNTNDRSLRKLVICLNKNLKVLRKLELEYKQGNNDLKSSITNISHDLRTPLTAIRGYLDLIDTNNLNDKEFKYLGIIDEKVKDLIELTEQLFDFSKSLDLKNNIPKDNICLNDILENSIASFYTLFKSHNIEPNITICEEKVYKLLNENMLKRIFENIISNALKYSEEEFNVKLLQDGTIEFSNKTNKLDKVSLEKLFDRYYTVKNTKKGNGIGLSIAKQLVELNNGEIDARYHKGTLIIKIEFKQ